MSALLGDLQGNVQRVVDHLGLISYHREVSARLLRAGEPSTLLPILHYALLDFSPHVAALVSARGFDLYGRDDASFTLAVFRLASLHLGLRPGLQAQQFLSRGFVERKLNFVVGVVQACLRLHAEAARAAAAAQRPPVAPYTAHHSLSPASASTRWKVRAQARVERAPSDANLAALLPAHAFSVPAPGERASSDAVYSRGLAPAEVTEAGLQDAASKFLSDAVALGSGAASSLATRRAQALHDALVAAPALAAGLSGGGAARAGWRARAAADCAHLAAGGGLSGLTSQALPPPVLPSQRPLLLARPGGSVGAARAHPPGVHAGTGTGGVRDWSLAPRAAAVAEFLSSGGSGGSEGSSGSGSGSVGGEDGGGGACADPRASASGNVTAHNITLGALAASSAAAAAARMGGAGAGELELGSLSQWVDGEGSGGGGSGGGAASALATGGALASSTGTAPSPEDPVARPSPSTVAAATAAAAAAAAAAPQQRPRTLAEAGAPGAAAAAEAVKARYMASMQAMSQSLLGNMHALTSGLAAGIESLEGKMRASEAKVEEVRARLGGAGAAGAGAAAPLPYATLPPPPPPPPPPPQRPSASAAFQASMATGYEALSAASSSGSGMDLAAMRAEVAASQARLSELREEAEARRAGLSRFTGGGGVAAALAAASAASAAAAAAELPSAAVANALRATLAQGVYSEGSSGSGSGSGSAAAAVQWAARGAAAAAAAQHNLYSLLPSSEITRLQERVAAGAGLALGAGGGGSVENLRDLARATLARAGAPAAAALASQQLRAAPAAAGGAAGGSEEHHEFMRSMAVRFANTEAMLARNAALLDSFEGGGAREYK